LARIGDPQAVPALRWAARHANPRVRAAAMASLGWSGGPADVPVAANALQDPDMDVREAARATLADLGGGQAASALTSALEQLEVNERLHAQQLLRWLDEHGEGKAPSARGDPSDPHAAALGASGSNGALTTWAGGERTLPRLTLSGLSTERPAGHRWPPPKFGGQPDWIGLPAWPVTEDLRPLVFYGQLPVGGDTPRMAYLFFSLDADVASWEPLGEGNALLVQPGDACQLQTVGQATGPGLYERVPERLGFRRRTRARPYERFVTLRPGADPEGWEGRAARGTASERHGDWNKIGGTPLFVSGRPGLGPGWEFAFQFTAAWAGHELANGAECYGFLRDGRGALMWQSP
jgi:HEAT repeats